jgi:hypothetical protein
MRGGIKVPVLVAAFVVAVIAFVGISEGMRRAKLEAQAEEAKEKLQSASENSGSSAVYYLPPSQSNVILTPGSVKQAPGLYSGPATLRVTVESQQRIAFGLVSKAELNDYSSANKVEYAVERLPCASAGTGNVTISCELPAEAKDLTLVIADLRDSAQANREMFNRGEDRDKPSSMVDYMIGVTVAVAFAPKATK